VAVGSLRQTVSQGNYEKRVYHDGLLRPVLTRERDTANASTIRYQAMTYDHENRPTLSSFPSSIASNRIGMETEYDALGRVITQTRTSDGSVSSREYLADNKVTVTDGENNASTTTYLSYGAPTYNKPILIEAPDSDDTQVEYNVFDQVTSTTQGNITEARFYDSYQQLCKSVRPETGITAFGYNNQSQPIWQAQGTNGSATSCDAAAVPASHKVLLSYDNLGQLQAENFPDTTSDNSYGYDANGNLVSLNSGPVSWSYLYNSLGGVEKETLSLDGKSFVLDWEYSGLGAVRSLKYPSGVLVDFAPNALSQPTKAGSYATNVSYHANGQIKQFTYGNGIVRNVALDSTGRIDLMTDSKGGVLKNSLDPSYDYNDNLAGLIDGVDAANNISNLSYDGLDRLASADGRWGKGSYSYDGLGNITSRSISGAAINYSYDNLNRLSKLSGAYGYSYQYDSRGNVTHNGRYGLTFNRANQVSEAKGIPYVYDGHNRRVKQTKPEGIHYSVYSSAGQLLHRKVEHGSHTDSVYLGKQLIAEVENGDSSLVTSDPSVAKPSIKFNTCLCI
jgi:YD repeat-containing protein